MVGTPDFTGEILEELGRRVGDLLIIEEQLRSLLFEAFFQTSLSAWRLAQFRSSSVDLEIVVDILKSSASDMYRN